VSDDTNVIAGQPVVLTGAVEMDAQKPPKVLIELARLKGHL